MTDTTNDDSIMSDLFVYRGVVCQLVYRYPWYATHDEPEQRLWGVVIYWPDGEVIKMARVHETPEDAVRWAHKQVDEQLKEPRGTHCPTTEATTD